MPQFKKSFQIRNPDGQIYIFHLLKYNFETSRKSQRLAFVVFTIFHMLLTKSDPLIPNSHIFFSLAIFYNLFFCFKTLNCPIVLKYCEFKKVAI